MRPIDADPSQLHLELNTTVDPAVALICRQEADSLGAALSRWGRFVRPVRVSTTNDRDDLRAAARLRTRDGERISDLVARGDQVQWATKKFRLELAAWTHPDTTHANSGIPHYSLDSNDLLTYAEPHVIRTFDLGNGQAAKDRDIALYSPGLCVVGTAYDNSHAWLEAGEGLAHLLLLARHHHVYASFLNQPIEVEDLRPRVARTIRSNGHAQLILRLGYGAHVNPTPRRTVAEVLI